MQWRLFVASMLEVRWTAVPAPATEDRLCRMSVVGTDCCALRGARWMLRATCYCCTHVVHAQAAKDGLCAMSFVGTAELTDQQARLFAYTFHLDERRVAEIRAHFTPIDHNAVSRMHGYPSRYFRCNELLGSAAAGSARCRTP